MPSKPNILIVGASGTGKSSSLERLLTGPLASVTEFFDFERKGLPFLFDPTKLAGFHEVDDYHKCKAEMTVAKNNPKSKVIVYDSLSKYLEIVREFARSTKSGWDVWNHYNAEVNNFIEFNKSTNKLVICTCLDEVVNMDTPDGGKVSRLRAFAQGKQYEGKLEKEFLIVLFTMTKKDGSTMKYKFQTQTDGLSSAKTPMWLKLDATMDNDVSVVVDKLLAQQG